MAPASSLVRSVLYLPASNARAVEKARTLPADVVVLDLEDAVAPEAKADARDAAVAAAMTGGFGGRLAVRINGLDTPWGADDLIALAQTPVTTVVAPKVSGPLDVTTLAPRLAPRVALWAMIETPAALLNLAAIAACARSGPLAALMLGVNDLAAALHTGPAPDREPLKPWLAQTVAAARANGLLAIDGVFNQLDDAAGFEAECAQGRLYGFDGKSLIHPSQIEAANAAFAPSKAQVAWARAVVVAFADPAAGGLGVVRAGGAMVERLHLEQAQALLARHEAARRDRPW